MDKDIDILINPKSNNYGDLSTILNSEIIHEIQYVVKFVLFFFLSHLQIFATSDPCLR